MKQSSIKFPLILLVVSVCVLVSTSIGVSLILDRWHTNEEHVRSSQVKPLWPEVAPSEAIRSTRTTADSATTKDATKSGAPESRSGDMGSSDMAEPKARVDAKIKSAPSHASSASLDAVVAGPDVELPAEADVGTNRSLHSVEIDRLEQQFRKEPHDPSWVDPVTKPLAQLLAQTPDLVGNEIIESACQSTLCRIEIRHHDAASRATFIPTVLRHAQRMPPGVEPILDYAIDATATLDGKARTVVFLARQSSPL